MNATKLLSFRRSHLRDPLLTDEASAAAMLQEEEEEEGTRVRAQKVAAWQWLMREGVPAEAPLPVEPSVRAPPPGPPMAPSDCRPLSRFALEAGLLPPPSLLNNADLATLAVSESTSRQKLGQEEASPISGYAEKKPTMAQSRDRRGLHLHFLAFQKLLRKLLPSPSGRKSMASAPAAIKSDSEKEDQHHYQRIVYHHHHYHHHYHYGGEGYPIDDTFLTEQPRLSTAQTRRRRHSESGLDCFAQQYPHWAESEAQSRHPIKPSSAGEAAIKTQTTINLQSPPIQRTASERFTDATSAEQLSLTDYETLSRITRCNSERRQPLHLQSVDAKNNYFSSGQFFDSSKWRSSNDAAGAPMASPAMQRRRRNSATINPSPYRLLEDIENL